MMDNLAKIPPLELARLAIVFLYFGWLGAMLIARAVGMVSPGWDRKRLRLMARSGIDHAQAEALLRQARDRVKFVTGLPVALGLAGVGILCLAVMAMPLTLDNRNAMQFIADVLKAALDLCIPYLLYTGLWLLLKANSISAALRVGSLVRAKPVDEETASRQTPFGVRMLGVALILTGLSIAYERWPRPTWLHVPPLIEHLLGVDGQAST